MMKMEGGRKMFRNWAGIGLLGLAIFAAGGARTRLCAQSERPTPASTHLKALLAKAYGLEKAQKTVEAVAAFDNVLKADPGDHAALVELGYLNGKLRHWNAAVKNFESALSQDAGNMRLRMDLGYAYEAAKNSDGASREFTAVSEQPGELQVQAQAALKALQDAAAAKQARVVEKGYAALRQGDKASARKAFERAKNENPRNAVVLKQLGYLDLADGKVAEAGSEFEAARGVDPADFGAALQLGYIYQRLGKTDEAKAAFTSALSSPDDKIRSAAEAALKVAPRSSQASTDMPASAQ